MPTMRQVKNVLCKPADHCTYHHLTLGRNMFDNTEDYDRNKMNEILLSPYNYIRQVGSNELFASKFIRAVNYWLSVPDDKMNAIEEIARMIMQAFVLLDDVQDDTAFRRSLPAAQRVYGVPLTINASYQVLGLGLKKILELGHPQAAEIFCDGLLVFMHGQGAEIHWRDSQSCPTEEQYKQVAADKTSYLLLIVRVMQLFSEDKTDYSKFIGNLGVYYNIRDEYCNLTKAEALEGESRAAEFKDLRRYNFCEDITEGRLSWPAIHALKGSDASIIYNILKQRTRDEALKRYCVSLFDKAGSLQYTRDTLRQLELQLHTELQLFGGNPLMLEFLDNLRHWGDTELVAGHVASV